MKNEKPIAIDITKEKIILFVIGVLTGAVISTGAFFAYIKLAGIGTSNTNQSMQMPGGGTPPEMPSGSQSGTPPEMPNGDQNGTPPEMPSGNTQSETSNSETNSDSTNSQNSQSGTLTDDTYLTSLTNADPTNNNINLNGYKLYVNGVEM